MKTNTPAAPRPPANDDEARRVTVTIAFSKAVASR